MVRWAIICGSSAIFVVRAAEPVGFWATSSRTIGFIRPTVGCLGIHSLKWLHQTGWMVHGAINFGGGTVSIVSAAEPVGFWATSGRAFSFSYRVTTGLDNSGSNSFYFWFHWAYRWAYRRAIIGGGCAIFVVRAAEPVGFWATPCWAFGFIGPTVRLNWLHQTEWVVRWAIICGSCAIFVVKAAEPVGFWATSSRTFGFIGPTLSGCRSNNGQQS